MRLSNVTCSIVLLLAVGGCPCPPDSPDLVAKRIDFEIAERQGEFTGLVRITGVVTSEGMGDFISSAGQQGVALFETIPGGAPVLVAEQDFVDLAMGEEVSVTFERQWDASSPAEGEFPPAYTLRIELEPDIFIDANDQNDDCPTANNDLERSGSGINDLLR